MMLYPTAHRNLSMGFPSAAISRLHACETEREKAQAISVSKFQVPHYIRSGSDSHFKVLHKWFCYQLICEMAQWIPVQVPIIMRLLLLLLLSHHLCQAQMHCSHTAHPSIPTCSHSPGSYCIKALPPTGPQAVKSDHWWAAGSLGRQ